MNTTVHIVASLGTTPNCFLSWSPRYISGQHYFFGQQRDFYQTLTKNATVEAYFYNNPEFPDAALEAYIRYALGIPSSDLTPTGANPLLGLTELVMVNAGITNLTGLELCTGLTSLFIAENAGLTSISPLQYLTNLESVYLADNGIQDLAALVNNAGIGEGDWVDVTGNPLSPVALYLQTHDLEQRGVSVSATPQENLDGDAFSNAEELRYLQYFFNDPDLVGDLYRAYLSSAAYPVISHECYENLDTVAVTVEVRGEGFIYLGDGYVTGGNTKTWEFARYSETCAALCTDPAGCSVSSVMLAAMPEPGWIFKGWHGDLFGRTGSMQTVVMDGDYNATAEFIQPVWTGPLDLGSALETLLVATGEIVQSSELFAFDRGGGGYVDGIYQYGGNGIPDFVEMLLIEELLCDTSYAFANGVWGSRVPHLPLSPFTPTPCPHLPHLPCPLSPADHASFPALLFFA